MLKDYTTPEFIEFCQLVFKGIEHADAKHGDWRDKSLPQCFGAMNDELTEVCEAIHESNIDGPHGIKAESVQVAVTAFKMFRRVS